jgi:hypothetical protein
MTSSGDSYNYSPLVWANKICNNSILTGKVFPNFWVIWVIFDDFIWGHVHPETWYERTGKCEGAIVRSFAGPRQGHAASVAQSAAVYLHAPWHQPHPHARYVPARVSTPLQHTTRTPTYPFHLLSLDVLSFVTAADHYVLNHLRQRHLYNYGVEATFARLASPVKCPTC